MPPNLEGTLNRARLVWRYNGRIYVSFPTLTRAYCALQKLTENGREAHYDAHSGGRHWIVFGAQVVMAFALV